jgi:hypothetical protein
MQTISHAKLKNSNEHPSIRNQIARETNTAHLPSNLTEISISLRSVTARGMLSLGLIRVKPGPVPRVA